MRPLPPGKVGIRIPSGYLPDLWRSCLGTPEWLIFSVSQSGTPWIRSRSWALCEHYAKIQHVRRGGFSFWTMWRGRPPGWSLTKFFLNAIAEVGFRTSFGPPLSRNRVLSRANHSYFLYSRQESMMRLRYLLLGLKWLEELQRKLAMQILSVSSGWWETTYNCQIHCFICHI